MKNVFKILGLSFLLSFCLLVSGLIYFFNETIKDMADE